MTSPTKYTGGCHCKKVRFEVEATLETLMSCNCSFCSRTGALLTFVPAPSFKLLAGDEQLTDYQFNKKILHHVFCSSCGIRSFTRGSMPDGSPMVAVNARCLDDVDVGAYPTKQFDGKNA